MNFYPARSTYSIKTKAPFSRFRFRSGFAPVLKTGSGSVTSSMTSVLCLPNRHVVFMCHLKITSLIKIMDLEKACIIHRNSSFGRGRFWLEIWHVGAFWCAQSRFAEGLSFEGEEEGGWLACLWLCVQIIWGLWKGCGLWSRKELDTMDGWWIPTYRQVCSIIFWLNVIKAVLKSRFVDVIIVVVNGGFLRDLFQKYLTWICPLHSSKGDWSFIFSRNVKECKDDR